MKQVGQNQLGVLVDGKFVPLEGDEYRCFVIDYMARFPERVSINPDGDENYKITVNIPFESKNIHVRLNGIKE